MNAAKQKIALGIVTIITSIILAIFGVSQIRQGVTEMNATAEGDGAATIHIEGAAHAKESGTHEMKVGTQEIKAENALYNDGQQMFLNVGLRGMTPYAQCSLFLLTPNQALPPKSANMATVAGNELSAGTNPGYARKTVLFSVPSIDPVTLDYVAVSSLASWSPTANWAQQIGWVGLVCGSAAVGTVGDNTGALVSLAQVNPARTVAATDTVTSAYKVFQR